MARRTTILRTAMAATGVVVAVASATALAAGLTACAASKPSPSSSQSASLSASSEPIRIGAIYCLTGSQAPLDAPSLDGARLAVDLINSGGGLLGRRVELVEWDGQTSASVVHVAAQSLVYGGTTAIIGLSDTELLLAAAPVAARAGIPFVTSGATSPLLTAKVPRWLFLACFGDNVQAAAAAEFATGKLHAHTVAVLYDRDSDYTNGLQKYFRESFTTAGGTVTFSRGFHGGDRTMAGLLKTAGGSASQGSGAGAGAGTAAGAGSGGSNDNGGGTGTANGSVVATRRIRADVIYLAAGPTDAGPLVRRLRAAGCTQPILGGDSFDDADLIAAAEATGGRVWFTTHAAFGFSRETVEMRRFTQAYRMAYGRTPQNAFAGLGFDAVNLVAQAITVAKSAAPDAVRQALSQIRSFDGATGLLRFPPQSRVPDKQVTIVRVGHRPVMAAELMPRHVPQP